MQDYFVSKGMLPPLPDWAKRPLIATCGITSSHDGIGDEALALSIKRLKKEIRRAKRGERTSFPLEKLEEELWKHKQRKRQLKADERQRRQDFLDVQTAFCAELVANGYPREMLPGENTPDSRNHILPLMQEAGVLPPSW